MFKVGDKAKGFKFDGDAYPLIGWADEMDDVVGVVGKVSYVGGESYSVHFKDSDVDWAYPKDLWYLAKVEEITSFNVGDRVKFKKSSIDSGMVDATEDDVFNISHVAPSKRDVWIEEHLGWWSTDHFEHVKEETVNNTGEQEIKWEVGQEVWDLILGKGTVFAVHNEDMRTFACQPIIIKFDSGDIFDYSVDGISNIPALKSLAGKRTLFFSEPKIEAEKFPPKKPFIPVLKKDDVILAKDYRGFRVIRVSSEDEHFVYNEDGTGFGKSGWEFRTLGEEIIFN